MKKMSITVSKLMCLIVVWSGFAKSANPDQMDTTINHEPKIQQSIDEVSAWLTSLKSADRGSVEIILVGVGNDCDFNTIQGALNSTDINTNYEIRVANDKEYHENLYVAHPNMILKGGYDHCGEAQNNNSNGQLVTFVAAEAEPAMTFRNISEGDGILFYYHLINFDISGGTGNQDEPSGGINILDNQIILNTDNLLIHDNHGFYGGGIYIEGALTEATINDTLVVLNSALDGGGLYCDDAQLLINGYSGITLNDAIGTQFKGNGGGLYLTNGCSLEMFSGTEGGFLDFRGIAANNANRNGGGIYVDNASVINLWGNLVIGDYGDLEQPINITSNVANLNNSSGGGGGIYAQGENTEINAYATIINDNEVASGATSDAGAIYISNDAVFNMTRLNFDCWNEYKCSQIQDNIVALDNNTTGGIMAISGADLTIKHTLISGHTSSGADLLFAQASKINFEGNMIVDNGDFMVDGFGDLMRFWNTHPDGIFMKSNTFANNDVDYLFNLSQNESFELQASIVKEQPGTEILYVNPNSSPVLSFKNLVTHESTSISGNNILVANPLFVDEIEQDYRLTADSPAIDFFNDHSSSNSYDIQNQLRGWDYPGKNDLGQPFDVGADEFYPENTADIELEMTLNTPAPHFEGQSLEFNLRVTNIGPDSANDISLRYVSSNITSPTILNDDLCSSTSGSAICYIDLLEQGEFVDLILSTQVINSGPFYLEMSSSTLSYDDNPDNDNALVSGTATALHADVSISDDLGDPEPLYANQVLTYQITIMNNGPNSAHEIWANFIGENVTLLSIENNNQCITLPCEISEELYNQSSHVFDVTIQINEPDDYNWLVEIITEGSTDNNIDNNSITHQGSAISNGDLQVMTSLLTAAPYYENQTVVFEVNYQNNGPYGVHFSEVSFNATNLENLTLSGDCTIFPCMPDTLIENGEVGSITVTASISSPGEFSLSASIGSDYAYDAIPENNQSLSEGTAGEDLDLIFNDGFE